jgi:hypothetical protein
MSTLIYLEVFGLSVSALVALKRGVFASQEKAEFIEIGTIKST